MREPSMKFPVTCPDCGKEALGEFQIAVIAGALITGKTLRLYASCHDVYWTATATEREQLRQYLAALKADAEQTARVGGPTATLAHSVAERSSIDLRR